MSYLSIMAKTIKIFIILAFIATGILYYFQNEILYMPIIPNSSRSPKDNPSHLRTPQNYNLNYEDVTIQLTDGIKLRGWLVLSNNLTKRTIIYYHQNAGNIGTRIPMLKMLTQQTQSNILLVAYRGFSDSDGIPTQKGLKEDGLAILKFAENHYKIDKNNIYIFGRSLGGAVGAYVASKLQTKIKGLILQVTFTSIDDMVDQLFPPLKYVKSFILQNYWRTIEIIKQINCPIFFIKASDDELIPISQMNQLIKKAKQYNKTIKQMTIIGATHNEVAQIQPQLYFTKFNQFLLGDYS